MICKHGNVASTCPLCAKEREQVGASVNKSSPEPHEQDPDQSQNSPEKSFEDMNLAEAMNEPGCGLTLVLMSIALLSMLFLGPFGIVIAIICLFIRKGLRP